MGGEGGNRNERNNYKGSKEFIEKLKQNQSKNNTREKRKNGTLGNTRHMQCKGGTMEMNHAYRRQRERDAGAYMDAHRLANGMHIIKGVQK